MAEFNCPICRRPIAGPTQPDQPLPKYFPFCSDRCQVIDLGRWLDGKYQVPATPADDEDPEDGSSPLG